MGRKRRTSDDARLPKYVYRHARGILYRPYKPGEKRRAILLLEDRESTHAQIWAAYEAFVTADKRGTLGWLLEQYMESRQFTHKGDRAKSQATIDEQRRQAAAIAAYPTRGGKPFGDVRLRDITPGVMRRYMDLRGDRDSAPTAANREKSLISSAWNWALSRDVVTQPNPCRLVQGNPERPREREITDAEYQAVHAMAPPVIRCAMALAALTGLRQGDLLALRREQETDDGIAVKNAKTGKRLVIEWTPALEAAWSDALSLRTVASVYVICTEHGQQYTSDGFRTIWGRVMRRAVESGAIREPFRWHDLRAYAAGMADDWRLLGHADRRTFERIYNRRPRRVRPSK